MADYGSLGFKCGIEIHQQLDCRKLFCSCPSIIDDNVDCITKRKLRAVIGETGEVDIAAAQEEKKSKLICYESGKDSSCLIDLDEEPPNPLNEEALSIVLQVASLLNAKVVDEIQVMRKTVVDGSNVSGFQRTALVAQDGILPTSKGDVRITSICVEEESARKISEDNENITYRLDRLGIPLIEIATAPDIISPEHAKETAEKIGMILRSTGKVKRGIGTIRQDLNTSITGGARTEIKGAQDLKLIPTLCENEMARQIKIVYMKGKLALPEKIVLVTECFKNTSSSLLKSKEVYCIPVPGMKQLFDDELLPKMKVGTDLAQVLRIKTEYKGLIHSGEDLGKYPITVEELHSFTRAAGLHENDAFILLVGGDAKSALSVIRDRLSDLNKGVPSEVRKADNETTSYLRPMPGAARMYPETDVLPICPKKIEHQKVELITDKAARYEKEFSLGSDLAMLVAKSDISHLFEECSISMTSLKPAFIAEALVSLPRELRRKENIDISDLSEDEFREILELVNSGKLPKESLSQALIAKKNKTFDLKNFASVSDDLLASEISKIVSEMKGKPIGAVMGEAMKRFRGKADGKKISDIVGKQMK